MPPIPGGFSAGEWFNVEKSVENVDKVPLLYKKCGKLGGQKWKYVL